MNTDLIFNDTKIAFSLKTDSELERAYFLFKMISIEPLVRIGTAATNFAIKAHLPIEGLIRSTVFDHFCGGVNEKDCMPTIDKMYTKNVHSVLDYSAEGKEVEEQFDLAMEKTLNTIKFGTERKSIPFAVFKPTGFGKLSLYQKMTEGEPLSAHEEIEWKRIKERYDIVSKAAFERDVPLLIDAEETWIQPVLDNWTFEMMLKYNSTKAIIYNTVQMYRHDRLAFLKDQYELAKSHGFIYGVKLVRGAYMEKERERAQNLGYPSPIQPDKAATDRDYNEALRFMVDHHAHFALCAGSHNEDSSMLLTQLMAEKNLENTNEKFFFAQLLGMSDHISYNLANAGYKVAKYVPFGPVKEVLPYLLRRADENTSVAGQTGRELSLISAEVSRRKKR